MYEALSNLRHEVSGRFFNWKISNPIQVGDARLTARTQRLLMLETLPEVKTFCSFVFVFEVQAFIDTHRAFPLKRQTVVTCIATLNKSHPEVKKERIGLNQH